MPIDISPRHSTAASRTARTTTHQTRAPNCTEPAHDSTAPAGREASEFDSGAAPRPRPDLPRRRNRTPIKAFGAVAMALESQFQAENRAHAQGEIARGTSKSAAGGFSQGLRPGARDPGPAQLRIVRGRRRNRGKESQGRGRQRDCSMADQNLTTSFSSEDVWRGACASRRRDRRLRLLQALVRFAAQAWTRCRSTFLRNIQPRHRARPEPQPTKLLLPNCTEPAHDSTAPAGREASEFAASAACGQGPTCRGAAIERQSRPSELSRLRSRANSRQGLAPARRARLRADHPRRPPVAFLKACDLALATRGRHNCDSCAAGAATAVKKVEADAVSVTVRSQIKI